MAHFRATIEGDKGQRSCLGNKDDGITATINGWTTGCLVRIWHDDETNEDVIVVAETSGSVETGQEPEVRAEWRVKC